MVPDEKTSPYVYRIVALLRDAAVARRMIPYLQASIAHRRSAEIIPLRVISIPRQTPPSLAQMEFAEEIQNWERRLAIELSNLHHSHLRITPICVCAHSLHAVISNLSEKEYIDQVLDTTRAGEETSRSAAKRHRRLATTVNFTVLVRDSGRTIRNVLAMVSENGNSVHAARLASALANSVDDAKLTLCRSTTSRARYRRAIHVVHRVAEDAGLTLSDFSSRVEILDDLSAGIAAVSDRFDVVFLGASARTRLAKMLFGSVPMYVLDHCDNTAVIVNGAGMRPHRMHEIIRGRLFAA